MGQDVCVLSFFALAGLGDRSLVDVVENLARGCDQVIGRSHGGVQQWPLPATSSSTQCVQCVCVCVV